MGNEALRASRSATFRRSRRSNKPGAGGGQQYIAEDEVDPSATNPELTPKPTRRMDKIRRSLSFRRKKKSSSDHNLQAGGGLSSGTQTVGRSGKLDSAMKKSSSEIPAVSGAASTPTPTNTSNVTTTTANGDTGAQVSRPALWVEDERKVRAGNCSFQVKYLGFQEVSDSRGMHICEQALEKLIALVYSTQIA